MSDSDQTRRDYLWSTMNMGQRITELRRMVDELIRANGRAHLDDIADKTLEATREPGRINGRFPRRPAVDGRCVISLAELEHLERVKGVARTLVEAIDHDHGNQMWFDEGPIIRALREALR